MSRTKLKPKRKRLLRTESLEQRTMLSATWQNPARALDVNNDGQATPLDALIVINHLNRKGLHAALQSRSHGLEPYYDTNGDGRVTPLDALLIINGLNRSQKLYSTARVEGGSEPAPAGFTSMILGNVAGDRSQLISLSTAVSQGGPAFNELGFFVVDDEAGSVNGLMPGDPHYADAVFSQPQRQVLYSRLGTFQTESTAEYAGDQRLGVYVLQQTTTRPDPTADFFLIEGGGLEGLSAVAIAWQDTVVELGQPVVVNNAPVIEPIEDQTISITQDQLEVPITASDLDDDPITLIAKASVVNPLAEIRQTYGLRSGGDYLTGLTGLDEKWLLGADDTSFFILPNGDLIQWLGSFDETAKAESLIARLNASVYDDPSLLLAAENELIAPVTLLFEDSTLLFIPDKGVYGEIIVRVGATDGTGVGIEQFNVYIDPTQATFDVENQTLEQLRQHVSTLSFEEIPSFVQSLHDFAGTLEGLAAAEVGDLARRIDFNHDQSRLQITAAEEWETEQRRLIQNDIDAVHRVEAELKILAAEYQAAWESITARVEDAMAVNTDGPPIFINGTDIGPVDTSPGEWFELDFRAIHPSHQPFYYFPDDFTLDATRFGDMLSVNPQTGLFRWVVPENASGDYAFTVVSEVNGNNTAEVSFTVRVGEAVKPTIQTLTISPTTMTDKASDPITLTALGVSHPSDKVDRVYFYQDANGNGIFDEGVDYWLGRDENGEDGWSWSGLPKPIEDADATTQVFFAQAIRYTFSAAHLSEPASVVANVIQTPDDVDIVSAIDTSDVIYGIYPGFTVPPILFPVVDAVGNVVNVYQASGGGDVWIQTNDQSPRKVASGVLVSTFAMNKRGEGILAWHDYWPECCYRDDHPLYLQSFSDAGRELGPIVTVPVRATFHDGGVWDAVDINENGDFILAWSGQGIWGSIHDLDEVTLVETEYAWPGHVAMNETGWSVFTGFTGSKGQVFDPAGHKMGSEFTVRDHSTERKVNFGLYELSLSDEGVALFLWSTPSYDINAQYNNPLIPKIPAVDILMRRLRLHIQPHLSGQALFITNEASLRAGESVELQFVFANTAPAPSATYDVAFHLSHDGTTDSSARLLGTYSAAAVPGNSASQVLETSFSLPQNTDPFWNSGTTSLHLVMTLVNSGSRISASVPYVSTQLIGDPGNDPGTGPGGDPGDDGSPGDGDPTDGSLKYIRPNLPLEQLKNTSLPRTYDVMELVGRQLVSALRGLKREAPYPLAGELEAMAAEVEVTLDTYFLKKWTLVEARAQAIAAAEANKAAAELAADQQKAREVADGQKQLELVREQNQKVIDKTLEASNKALQDERERLRDKINEARKSVEDRDREIEQLEQGGSDGFSLGGVLGQLVKGGEKIVGCAANLKHCGEQAVHELNKRKKELLKARDEAVRVAGPIITEALADLEELFPAAQKTFDRLMQPYRTAIQAGKDFFYEKLLPEIEERREKAYRDANSAYETQKAKAPDLSGVINIQAAAPVFEQAIGGLSSAVESIRNPAGILPALGDQLSRIPSSNPIGKVQDISNTAAIFVGSHVLDGLVSVGKTLSPVISVVKGAGGDLAEWAKDTGGKAGDWIEEKGEVIVEWVKDKVGDVLDEELIAYSVCSDMDLSLNFLNGSVYVNVEIGPGLAYDSRKLRELLSGQISLPDIDPLEALSTFYGFELYESSNYNEVRAAQYAEFGPQNVYFASPRFVSYLGVETVAEIVTEAFLTGGAAAEDALADLAEQVRLELNDVLAWLQIKGQDQLGQLAGGLIQSIFTQTDYVTPHIELRWTPVTFRYKLKEAPVIGKVVELITGDKAELSDLIGGRDLAVDLPHAGFAIIWKAPEVEDPLNPQTIDAALNGYLDGFDEQQFSGDLLNADLLDVALSELEDAGVPDDLMQFVAAIRNRSLYALEFEAALAQLLSRQLGLDRELVRDALSTGNVIVDLSSSPAAAQLAGLLGTLAFGNRGSARVDTMEFNLSTFSLSVTASLCHQHSLGSVASILDFLGQPLH